MNRIICKRLLNSAKIKLVWLSISFFIIYFFICNLQSSLYLFAQQPTQEWVRRFTNGDFASGLSVKLDSIGNVYVLVANPIADSTLGYYCVLKYTSIGTFIWSTYYNSPGNLSDQPNSFAVTNGGEIYVTGIYQINFTNHITTVKFNTNGVLQWARVYNGGGPADGADDIKLDKLGNIIIVGGSAVNNNLAYGLTIKYLPNGDSAWVRKFSPFPRYSHNSKLAIDDSNNIYIAGDYDTNNGDDLILKYNTNGGLIWYTTYDSPQHLGDVGTHIALDSNRNIYVVGTTYIPSSAL